MNNLKNRVLFLVSMLLLSTQSLYPISVNFSNIVCTVTENATPTVSTPCSPIMASLVNQALSQSEALIVDNIPVTPSTMQGFLTSMGDASTNGLRGVNIDYATDLKYFMVGLGLGASFTGVKTMMESATTQNFDKLDPSKNGGNLPPLGLSPVLSFGFGLKLSFLPGFLKKVNVFGSYFGFDKQTIEGYTNQAFAMTDPITKVDFGMKYYSLMGQYKVINKIDLPKIPVIGGIIRWGGLDFTSGLQLSNVYANVEISKNIDRCLSNDPATATDSTCALGGVMDLRDMKVATNTKAGLNFTTYSVPLELSTSLRLFWFFTFFAGGAVDLNFGNSTIDAKPTAVVQSDLKNQFNGGSTVHFSANADADLGNSSVPDMITNRIFGGLQLNLTLLKIVLQGGYALQSQTGHANVGIRLAI